MCEQCVAKTVMYVGHNSQEVLPGYFLVKATENGNYMNRGDWGLVRCNDPDYIWSINPVRDPADGLTDEQIDTLTDGVFEGYDRAVKNLEESLNKGCFDKAVWLGTSMKQAGYRPKKHGYRGACWLCNYLAKFLETAKVEKQ